jgi:enoyl-CoA hydratase/carnithine racemase
MKPDPVALECRDGYAHLVLDAPPGNVMDRAFFASFAASVRRLGTLPGNVRGVVVHGRGRHFSSGARLDDLTGPAAGGGGRVDDLAFLVEATASFQALASLPCPTVAVVRGACLGSGLELALACRFRVAAPSAVFALPETTFGIIPGCGGTVRLPRLIGRGRALEMILTGEMVDAGAALGMGLADAVVPFDDPAATGREFLRGR